MKTARTLFLSLLFFVFLPLKAATVYISCHENIDIDHLKTALMLKNLDVIDTPDGAQFDLCLRTKNKTQIITSGSGVRLGAGYGHGFNHRSNYYGGGISFDPFWDDDRISTSEQTTLELQIKDHQGRSVWRNEKSYSGTKQINKTLKVLINSIPLSIVTQSNHTSRQNQPHSIEYE